MITVQADVQKIIWEYTTETTQTHSYLNEKKTNNV